MRHTYELLASIFLLWVGGIGCGSDGERAEGQANLNGLQAIEAKIADLSKQIQASPSGTLYFTRSQAYVESCDLILATLSDKDTIGELRKKQDELNKLAMADIDEAIRLDSKNPEFFRLRSSLHSRAGRMDLSKLDSLRAAVIVQDQKKSASRGKSAEQLREEEAAEKKRLIQILESGGTLTAEQQASLEKDDPINRLAKSGNMRSAEVGSVSAMGLLGVIILVLIFLIIRR